VSIFYKQLLVSGLVALASALLVTPAVRRVALRLGLVDHPDGRRKMHASPVPRVGGIAIAVSYIAACGMLFFLTDAASREALGTVLRLAPAVALVFCLGLWDDIFGLGALPKLAGQTVAAILAYQAGVQVTGVQGWLTSDYLSFPLTIIWLIICSNAVNLIDGLDGLAAGIGLFATITIIAAALLHGNWALALLTVPLAGSLVGFLRYNFNPASIFLGDCGSLMIGFGLGCYAVLWGQKSATILGITAPLMALAIPLIDVALAVARRFLVGKPIFLADRGHIHHRLLDRGWTPRRAALLIYGCCALAAMFSLLTAMERTNYAGLVIVGFTASAWIGVQHLGYHEFKVARRLMQLFRVMVNSQVCLAAFRQRLLQAQTEEEIWEIVRDGAKEFGFSGVEMSFRENNYQAVWDQRRAWQIRIAIRPNGWIALDRVFGRDSDPTAVSGFVHTLESALRVKGAIGLKGDWDRPYHRAVREEMEEVR
jgi:UDP-GlcNAc:undecaprenyl-phosphate/decaprenyl-phosphate GlcNAc-1-phosphate transferase